MPALAYMLIQAEHGKIAQVSEKLLKFKEIAEAHTLYGEYDLVAKVEADSMAKLQDFVATKIRPIKEIKATETMIASDVF